MYGGWRCISLRQVQITRHHRECYNTSIWGELQYFDKAENVRCRRVRQRWWRSCALGTVVLRNKVIAFHPEHHTAVIKLSTRLDTRFLACAITGLSSFTDDGTVRTRWGETVFISGGTLSSAGIMSSTISHFCIKIRMRLQIKLHFLNKIHHGFVKNWPIYCGRVCTVSGS